jgi:hypothetical protein
LGLVHYRPHLSFVFKSLERKVKLMPEIFSKRGVTAVICLMAFSAMNGCSKPKPWETTHPTSGQVTFKGAPVADAELSFYPDDASFPTSVRPKAKTTADGKFVAWTNEQGDGLPAGSYKVTIIHNVVAISKDTVVAKPNDLPAKYAALDTTDLQVKIVPGKNVIPSFDLK